ncbi:MAG: DUF58 domain-containing protein [Candidatus Tectomicrobia bacterium]
MHLIPTPRFIGLLACGAPLWLAAVWLPGGVGVAIIYLTALLYVSLREAWSLPPAQMLQVSRELPQRFSLDTEQEIGLSITNHSAAFLRLRVRDEIPQALGSSAPLLAGTLHAAQRVRWTYRVRPQRRGQHTYGNVVLRLEHEFGLLQRQIRLPVHDTVKIYPRFADMHDYALLAKIDQRDDVVKRPRRVRGHGTEFESLRPYESGEDLRLVDWKASARQGALISRNLRIERGQQLAILIDAGRLMREPLGKFPRFEYALNAAVMLSYVAQKRGDSVAVAAFSNRIESFLPPTRGPSIIPRVLESLYPVEPRALEADYWRVMADVMGRLKRRSLVIMLTDVLDAAGSTGLMANLLRAAAKHLVLCVVLHNRHIMDRADAMPTDLDTTYSKAAASQVELQRHLALQHMRSRGIQVLESDPDHFSVHLVQRYLDIRQRDLL